MYEVSLDRPGFCVAAHVGTLRQTPGAQRNAAFAEARDRFGCRSVRHTYSDTRARLGESMRSPAAVLRRPAITPARTAQPVRTVTSASLIGDILGGIGDAVLPGSGTIIRGIDRAISGGDDRAGANGRGGVALPGFNPPTARGAATGCTPPLVMDQSGLCVAPGSPGDLSTNGAAVAGAFQRPRAEQRRVLVCGKFANGKRGILWFNPMTNEVVCLPTGVSGRAWGLIRKNKPRRKPYVSAAEKKKLDDIKAVQKKAKEFASAAGFKTEKKGQKAKK